MELVVGDCGALWGDRGVQADRPAANRVELTFNEEEAAAFFKMRAGVIHTDFERGFIRAQTIAFDDFIQYKGESGAKEAGKMRAEGKDYEVVDGDTMEIRFNV